MSKPGWIKLHRQIMDSEFYKEPRKFSKYEAWIDILLRANHEEEEGIKPGTFLASYGELAKTWGWSKSTTWNFLKYLSRQNMITFELNENGTDRRTVVAIAKWDLYQGKKNAKRNESGTKNEFLPITEKEEKNIYSEIFSYWNEQKIIKHQELTPEMVKAIDKISKTLSLSQIKVCIERYKKILEDDSFFFSYRWTLVDFLSRKNGIKDFLDDGAKWVSYQSSKKEVKPLEQTSIFIDDDELNSRWE
jgi:hypothetical protein